MTELADALGFTASLKPGEKINYTKIARNYDCSCSTFSRQHCGVCASREAGYAEQRQASTCCVY
ncbi:uncharacterized protein M421DRAFT_424842 [Didymella exigua CBS 183.55]|uniref:HTH psq-type domain-containing protein n=1 Tax=Didymella exigua CBS 183.55 TaxID=1150837 RepID=A0A6A5RAT1_9PLEO|nr:uncharacterized protein M421DRAFT_424842 [Didymella exigua CBS 183.55]KAF1924390.1 hypothetical protein M421DRAFT_424842 [Didymella exigua CBS 183.55]